MSRRTLYFLVLIAVVGIGGLLFINQLPSQGPSLSVGTEQSADDIDTSIVQEMSLGSPQANVTVIEYASFTCSHCRNFHEEVFGRLKVDYIDTGKINFLYREVYFDRFGLWAGIVARCGGADRYFGIANLIYRRQSEWTAGGDPATITANLRTIGKTAGLTEEQLDACFADADKAQAMVALYQQNAQADDVQSTPTFVINGEKFSNMNYDEFTAVLDEKLAE